MKSNSKKSSLLVGHGIIVFGLIFFSVGISVLYKEMSASGSLRGNNNTFVGTIFFLIGAAIMLLGNWIRQKIKMADELRIRYADQPWMRREDWALGYSLPNEKLSLKFTFLFLFLWSAITTPASIIVLIKEDLEKKPFLAFVFIFPILAVLMLFQTIKQRKKFQIIGSAKFHFPRFGLIGGKLEGNISLENTHEIASSLLVVLSNTYTYTDGNGDNSSKRVDILWQDEKTVSPMQMGEIIYIPIHFDIPFDMTPTFYEESLQDSPVSRHGIYEWELAVQIDNSKMYNKLTYDVPVFKTKESDPSKTLSNEIKNIAEKNSSYRPTSFKVNEQNGIQKIDFPKSIPQIGPAFMVIGFIAICSGIFFGFQFFKDPTFFSLFNIFFASAMLGVGSLLFFVGFLTHFQKVSLELSSLEILIRKKIWTFVREERVALKDIKDVQLKIGAQQSSKAYYDLLIQTHSRPTAVRIPTAIPKKEDAQWIAGKLLNRAMDCE